MIGIALSFNHHMYAPVLLMFWPNSSRFFHFDACWTIGNKRQRQAETPAERHTSQTTQLQGIITKQLAEVQKLKAEKEEIQTSYQELSASHEKSQNENKLLKKVLAIKQERQDQFVSQLEDAHRYKEQAEQVIAMLRQHLHNQAHQSHGPSNGFTGGPPNVY